MSVSIKNLSFKIGNCSISNLSLHLAEGEYFILSGPNGSGKSLLLKLICGVYKPHGGEILLQGKNVTSLEIWKRNIGYIPQNALLFPHMDVFQNVEYGLKMRNISKKERRPKVDEMLEMLGIQNLKTRKIHGLSGGENQKVNLARALVYKPSVLLLDEPLSAIDEKMRDSLCHELKNIQKKTKVTTIHVSHNRQETDLVADRIGYFSNGSISMRELSGHGTKTIGKVTNTFEETGSPRIDAERHNGVPLSLQAADSRYEN
jgi:molybdate/tungstate transport system ATP-binding protein